MRDMESIAGSSLPFICNLNELNSGYSADGYARVRGFSVLMVTFSVGALSAMNAIAGMYCEHVPCLVLVGAPNSNSSTDGEIVHHTLGEVRYDYARRMAEEITAASATIARAADTPILLHEMVEAALTHRQPVYLEIASNLSSEPVLPGAGSSAPLAPLPSPLSMSALPLSSDAQTLSAAVTATVSLLQGSSRPLILGGGHLRHLKQASAVGSGAGLSSLLSLLDVSGYGYACMMDAKAIVNEDHPSFIGIYAGGVAVLPGLSEGGGALVKAVVESADAALLVGCILSDYATAGHALRLPAVDRQVEVFPQYVKVAGSVYHRVAMTDFLQQLARAAGLKRSSTLVDDFRKRLHDFSGAQDESKSREAEEKAAPSSALSMRTVHRQLQQWVTASNAGGGSASASSPPPPAHVLVDCGDSWMTGLKLRLPPHGSFAVQLQYGSLGWSVPATLGYALALRDADSSGRLVTLVGDGAFQMSPQEISSLLRYAVSPLVLVMNNAAYLVENEIVPGDFNDLSEWDYVALVRAMHSRGRGVGREQQLWTARVSTGEELRLALEEAGRRDMLCVVEVVLEKDDCNPELKEWAKSLHPSASRPPRV